MSDSDPITRLQAAPRIAAGLVIVGLVSLAACQGTESPTESQTLVATTVTLSSSILSFSAVGEAQQLNATVSDQHGAAMTGASILWASSSSGVC